MTELLPALPAPLCQADPRCDRVPCFQAHLEAASGSRRVRTHAELRAHHLDDTVYALTTWARGEGPQGHVTVLAIDQLGSAQTSPAWSRNGLAFGAIPISA